MLFDLVQVGMQDPRIPPSLEMINNPQIAEKYRILPSLIFDLPSNLNYLMGVWECGNELTWFGRWPIEKMLMVFVHLNGRVNEVF